MELNVTEQRYSDGNLQLAEPHFDQEATVLSARPVVPLSEIKARVVSQRHLVFGLSILASLLVGVLGATLVFRQRGPQPAAEVVETVIAGSGVTIDESVVPSTATGKIKEGVTAVPDARVTSVDKPAEVPTRVVVQPKAREKTHPGKAETRSTRLVSEEEERELRSAERIEARRLRRREMRDEQYPRGRGRRRADDLLRIREIFEGSRRP